jgi:hypothetical protein
VTALRDALREAADHVPAYPVVDAAIARGRRRRRATAVASAASVVCVMAVLTSLVLPVLGRGTTSPAEPHPDVVSLPALIGPPGPFVGSVAERPGPASVIFSAAGNVVAVGATTDTYHQLFAPTARPGRDALLSPDGDRIAYEDRDAIAVVDLRSGATRRYPVEDRRANTYRPLAWLPDGRFLVVLTVVPAADPTTEGITKRLAILDLDRGTADVFAETTWPIALAGFAVAVSPDGRRIAYQYDEFVAVFDRTSRAKTNFRLSPAPSRAVLAGKGAWTPDGRSLAILCRDTDRWDDSRWELRLVDPATGIERDPANRPGASGLGLMRLLGWNARTGSPVVAGYHAAGTADGSSLGRGVDETLSIGVTAMGVYELTGGEPVARVQPVDGITMLDVADVAIAAGQTRPGEPPWAPPVLVVIALAASAVIGLGLAGCALMRRVRPA